MQLNRKRRALEREHEALSEQRYRVAATIKKLEKLLVGTEAGG